MTSGSTFRLCDLLSPASLSCLARVAPAAVARLASEPQPADSWAVWEPAEVVARIMTERPAAPARRVA